MVTPFGEWGEKGTGMRTKVWEGLTWSRTEKQEKKRVRSSRLCRRG